MNKTIKILLTIAVLVIMIIIVSIISFKYLTKKAEEKQINAVLDYFSYIEEHNYEKMYDLISSSSKEKISKDEFIERNKNIYEGLDATGFEINIESLQKIDNSNKEILIAPAKCPSSYSCGLLTSIKKLSFSSCNFLSSL